jgi:hypothetical protein
MLRDNEKQMKKGADPRADSLLFPEISRDPLTSR